MEPSLTNQLDEILPKLRSAIAAMERLNYTDVVGVLRSGLDWSVGGQRQSLNAGDMRALLAEIERLHTENVRMRRWIGDAMSGEVTEGMKRRAAGDKLADEPEKSSESQ